MNEVTFTTPPARPDPLRPANVVRVLLDPEQSKMFEGFGECFTLAGKGSYPGAHDRIVLYLAQVDTRTAAAACGVLLGTHKATRIRKPPAPPQATIPAIPARTP